MSTLQRQVEENSSAIKQIVDNAQDILSLTPSGGTIDNDDVFLFQKNSGGSNLSIKYSELLALFGGGGAVSLPFVTPQDYGAVGDGVTDDYSAFQSMFDDLVTQGKNLPVIIPAGDYLINTSIDLPNIDDDKKTLLIQGYGARIDTSALNISIFQRKVADQTEASSVISGTRYVIRGIFFYGTNETGQTAIDIDASYMTVIENCYFTRTGKGILLTFALNATIRNCEFTQVYDRPITLRSAGDDLAGGGAVWTGGSLQYSASNASKIISCRVFGATTQHSAFTVLASDLVEIDGCISEGSGALYDVYFDYQGSTTVKNFIVKNIHCEAPNAKVNVKAAIGGSIIIDKIRRSYPAALCDFSGSLGGSSIWISNIAYWGNMPTTSPWFYHTNGGGYGGTPGGQSTGCQWVFENIRNVASDLTDATNWEDDTLPSSFTITDNNGNDGCIIQTNKYTFKGKTPTSNSWIDLDKMNLKSLVDDDSNVNIGKRGGTYGRPRGIYAGSYGFETIGDFIGIKNGGGLQLRSPDSLTNSKMTIDNNGDFIGQGLSVTKKINIVGGADVQNLNSTRKLLIPAPGAGKRILINSISFEKESSLTGYDHTDGALFIEYDTGDDYIMEARFVTTSTDQRSGMFVIREGVAGDEMIKENEGIYLTTANNATVGLGDVNIYITYAIITE